MNIGATKEILNGEQIFNNLCFNDELLLCLISDHMKYH